MDRLVRAIHAFLEQTAVIPGRCEASNPESRGCFATLHYIEIRVRATRALE